MPSTHLLLLLLLLPLYTPTHILTYIMTKTELNTISALPYASSAWIINCINATTVKQNITDLKCYMQLISNPNYFFYPACVRKSLALKTLVSAAD